MAVPNATADAGASAAGSEAVGTSDTSPALSRLSTVYGGGGLFGIAYGLGVADALLNLGVPLRGAEALGTSAGSWVASCLATNTSFDHLCTLPAIRVPNRSSGMLRDLAGELFGERRSSLVPASAVRVPSGRPVLLSGAEHALADLVAASSAVPFLFPPARIGRRFFADGGVRSLAHADRAAPAQHLLVVAPIAGPMFATAGRAMEAMLRREMRRWQQRTGGVVHLIRPNRRVAELARHPLDLFDKDRATAAYPLAYMQAARLAMTSPSWAQLTVSPRPAGQAAGRKSLAAPAHRELATVRAGG